MFGELNERIGLSSFNENAGILVSSPKAQVYYHADLPAQMLFQLMGHKRVLFYPAQKPFIAPEHLEHIAVADAEVGIPYSEWYDEYARTFEFSPGQMVQWPHTAPHRIENHDCLNVSMTIEYSTSATRRNYIVNLANGILRYQVGWTPRSRALSGPSFLAKAVLGKTLRNSPWVKKKKRKQIEFRLDRRQAGSRRRSGRVMTNLAEPIAPTRIAATALVAHPPSAEPATIVVGDRARLSPLALPQDRYEIRIDRQVDGLADRLRGSLQAMAATAFQTPVWLAAWYATIGTAIGEPMLVTIVESGTGEIAAILPLVRRTDRRLTIVEFADGGVSDNNAPILGPAAPVDAAGASALWPRAAQGDAGRRPPALHQDAGDDRRPRQSVRADRRLPRRRRQPERRDDRRDAGSATSNRSSAGSARSSGGAGASSWVTTAPRSSASWTRTGPPMCSRSWSASSRIT